GQYKGRSIKNVPKKYLEKIVDNKNVPLDDELREKIRKQLKSYNSQKKRNRKITFGKHAGKTFYELPIPYLEQLLKDETLDNVSRSIIKKILKNRPKSKSFVLKFGKYNGCHITEVPINYLRWIIRASKCSKEVINEAMKELERRKRTKKL